jgi:steroid delta-isomerase-like uncharacterized protein
VSTPEKNKALIRRYFDEVTNGKNLAVRDEVYAPVFIRHTAAGPQRVDGERGKQTVSAFLAAFPDLWCTIEDLVAEGDRVVARLTCRGTQRGAFMGVPATDRQVTWAAIDFFRIAEGKVVEVWGQVDALGLLQQLGAIPASARGA